jgi:hypothetical protein
MLKGSKALVTGGSKRIGFACAKGLAMEGADVVLHFNSSEKEANKSVKVLKEFSGKVSALHGDLNNPEVAETLVEKAESENGPIDILLNNASIFPEDQMLNCSLESLQTNVTVNAFAPLALARSMAKKGQQGTIINMLDARMNDYDANHFSYHVSKRMLSDFTRMMSLEFAPKIRVNAIAPGLILPPEGKDDSYLEGLASSNPLHAVGSVEDIVRTMLFLIESTFITGQTIYVDGGRHMKGKVYE